MTPSSAMSKAVFVLITLVFMLTYTQEQELTVFGLSTIASGTALSMAFIAFAFVADWFFSKFSLQHFNTVSIGLFFGYLFALGLTHTFTAMTSALDLQIVKIESDLITSSLYLFSLYLGVSLTLRASENLHLSIPFVHMAEQSIKNKKVLLDPSILSDPRVIDLCSSGLLDQKLVLSTEVLKNLSNKAEDGDEQTKAKAKQAIETAKKLENNKSLDLQVNNTPFDERESIESQLVKLARKLDAHILTADISQIQSSSHEDIKIVNINSLSNALKPIMQAGEFIKIKIQRTGKEALQGVGYLEDGTMVVVNGGGEFIGDIVEARVLSVKHTSSGRMVFCNLCEDFTQTVSKQTSPYTHGQSNKEEESSEDEREKVLVARPENTRQSNQERKAPSPSHQIKKSQNPKNKNH
ncbi:MAG: TRAM domain-containing protein [Chlamydiales bacterium]|nr:TRAM domain-containing protein [Chlamydiales bacterium]